MSATIRLDWIDVAKGLAIFLVTLLHANIVFEQIDVDTGVSADVHRFLEPIRMPLFFTVSGLFASSVINGSAEQLWNRRLATYLWLMVLWSCIMWLIGMHPTLAGDPAYPRDLLSLAKTIIRPLGSIWFLWCLPMYFVLSRIIRRVDARILLVVLPIVSFAGYAIDNSKIHNGVLNLIAGSVAYTNALKYYVFFWAASQFRNVVINAVPNSLFQIIGLTALFSGLTYGGVVAQHITVESLLALPASFAGVLLLLSLSKTLSHAAPPIGNALSALGARTVPLYVIQLPFMMLIILPLEDHFTETPTFAELLHIPLAILTVFVAWGCGLAANLLGMRWLFAAPAGIKINGARTQLIAGSSDEARAVQRPKP